MFFSTLLINSQGHLENNTVLLPLEAYNKFLYMIDLYMIDLLFSAESKHYISPSVLLWPHCTCSLNNPIVILPNTNLKNPLDGYNSMKVNQMKSVWNIPKDF